MAFSHLCLIVVLLLIAVRRFGSLRLAIWQIMLGGALAVLLAGSISPAAAWGAVDWEVILFLFGVFVVGQALVESGWLYQMSARLLSRCGSAEGLLLAVIFGAGLGSALLMNDTLAVIGTPLVLMFAREHRLPPQLLLLALAFAVTTGSVLSPVGNPQNLLIALYGGLDQPFITFFAGLWLPTLLSLLLTYGVLRSLYRRQIHAEPLDHCPLERLDPRRVRVARAALVLLVGGITVKIGAAFWLPEWNPGLAWIALLAAMPPLLGCPHRRRLLQRVDWHTLIFFCALFILTAAVWQEPATAGWLAAASLGEGPQGTYLFALGASQLVSNVPLVSLYLPMLQGAGAESMLALAAGSTLAGNLLIMGAASNVIILQRAEREGVHLGFLEFARPGALLTLLQSLLFLAWFGW